MNKQEHPFMLESFPDAILHLDGDAFFTSIEQALRPSLRNKPVVTGAERGIIACASYEAKALGIQRGIKLWDAKKMCPDLAVLPSDYETYSLYSKRMFDIIREFTPMVEEYSIDEGFADLSGMRRVFRTSYDSIARQIQEQIEKHLGLTVSVGLSTSKSLAKLASDFRKPRGFTAVPGRYIHHFLKKVPLEDVWGIGPSSARLLHKHGLNTAYDFTLQPESWVDKLLHKPGKEIWNELRGNSVYPVTTEEQSSFASISKCKTFTAPSDNRDFVYAQLIRILESAFIKTRRYQLKTKMISVGLRQEDFFQEGLTARLNRATSTAQETVPIIRELFDRLYQPGTAYRCVMVLLERMESDKVRQYDLFEDRLRIDNLSRLAHAIDDINNQFGKHTVSLATALYLDHHRKTSRDKLPWRKQNLLNGENRRRHLNIPRMDIEV